MSVFGANQDNAVIKQIEATHGVDDSHFNIKSLLSIIHDIVIFSKSQKINDVHYTGDKGNRSLDHKLMLKINNISWEILGKCSGGENTNQDVLDIFNALSSFFWPGKAVIALAAFAVNYGEFCLLEQLRSTDPVAQSLALLEQFPSEPSNFHDMADQLINAILNLINCISEYENLRSHNYFETETLKEMASHIPTDSYWIIRSIVACQSQLLNLTTYGYTSSSIEPFDINFLVHKVDQLRFSMREQLNSCYGQAEVKRSETVIQNLKEILEIPSKDNVPMLKALISDKEDKPLYDGLSKEMVSIDTLKRKIVLLYLSELKYSIFELSFLLEMYKQYDQKPEDYEIVWFPMIEKSLLMKPEKKKAYEDMKNIMPWLTFRDISLLDHAVVRYIRNEWQFKSKSMIKVIDGQGRLLKDHNAIHMIFIWGNLAKPFTRKAEQILWEKEKWSLELLLNNIVPSAIHSANEGKLICLYGGEDLNWIQKFRTTILDTALEAHVPITTLFMGSSNMSKEMVNKYNAAISTTDARTDTIVDYTKMMQFWGRIESIWHSRAQSGAHVESDDIIRGVFKMRSFDCSTRGWAVIIQGSEEMAKGFGDAMLKCLSEYNMWMGKINEGKGFVAALRDHMNMRIFDVSNLRNTLIVPKTENGIFPRKIDCFECQREMNMSIRFTCCGD